MSSTGQQIKNAAIAKAKSVAAANAANGSGNGSASKKRKGNTTLKPIITSEGNGGGADTRGSSAASANK